MINPPQGNNTGNGNFESINTADGFNSDIGDSVDYLDPRWWSRTNALVCRWTPGTSLISASSGSAGTTNNFSEFATFTGSTSGSTARLQSQAWKRVRGSPSWDNGSSMRVQMEFISGTSDVIMYAVIGDYQSGSDRKIAGFKLEDGNLLGVVNDGTGENTTTLESNLGTAKRTGRVEVDGTAVEFYLDGTKQGEIATGLPSGSASDKPFTLYAENTAGVNRQIVSSDLTVVRLP